MQTEGFLPEIDGPTNNGEVLGGISDVQWQAFTIEEEFSKSKIPTSEKFNSLQQRVPPTIPTPSADNVVISKVSIEDKSAFGSANTDTTNFDVQKILDRELLRIFFHYVAQKTPDGSSSMASTKDHLNFCSKLIGKSLKDAKEQVVDDCNKGGLLGLENCVQNGTKKCGRYQEGSGGETACTPGNEGKTMGKVEINDLKSDENEDREMEDEMRVEQVVVVDQTSKHESENWPLLETIMQLDDIKEKELDAEIYDDTFPSDLLPSIGHGKRLRHFKS